MIAKHPILFNPFVVQAKVEFPYVQFPFDQKQESSVYFLQTFSLTFFNSEQ